MSSPGQRSRPALGEQVPLGTLYDARTDRFLSQSLLKREYQLSEEDVSISRPNNPPVNLVLKDSYQAKFDLMNVDPDLAASILARFVVLRGAAVYLHNELQGDDMFHATVSHKITSVQEKLQIMRTRLQASIDGEVMRNQQATHFVSGIEWGIQTIVSIKHEPSSSETRPTVESRFQAEVAKFISSIQSTQSSNVQDHSRSQPTGIPLEITTYSDVFTSDGVVMKDLDEALRQLRLIPVHIEHEYANKGLPTMYTLVPITFLGLFMEVEGGSNPPMTPVSLETERRFIQLFDQFDSCQQKLDGLYAYVSQHHQYCTENYIDEVRMRLGKLRSSLESLGEQYAKALFDVRRGAGQPGLLDSLYDFYASGDSSPTILTGIISGQLAKIRFIVEASQLGATYVSSIDSLASLLPGRDAYILSFSETAMKDSKHWDCNVVLFKELLADREPKTLYIVADHDSGEQLLPQSHISHYEKGREVSADVLEQRSWLEKQCFVRYDMDTLETNNVQRPLKRRFVTMPCPGSNCDRQQICEWLCSRCHAPVEFGFTDQYIYCDCGRSMYKNYNFKCNHPSHGSEYEHCQSPRVLSQLISLGDSDTVNILILGETGVGKSTFINAFVNYLTFETLDDAKAVEQLNWVIPCSFSTQVIDKNRPDGKIEQIEIKVGARDDERDGSKGASATQRTAVYPVTIGNRTIRLIDTPGIGDTRGIHYDKQNMADILSTLSSYDDLHGILILLKSNNSRLTVTFNFCMKELLTHLHRSAADNMAFGFTNTRISNYLPGDTFGPLETIMQDHSDVGLSLTGNTIYCFDSESFRYLAAFKNGTLMENEEDFRRSWQHSRKETLRLVEYFKSRTPHKVQSTISLNGARQLIANLTKPMAEISALIKANITMSEDKIKEVGDTLITGDNLRQRLHLQKKHLRSKQLGNPRTVCKDKSCVEFKDNGDGEVVIVYKTHCHPVCYLNDVKADQVAHPGLVECAAFNGTSHCQRCRHPWQSHLHVLYELEEYMATVTDTEVQRQLQANANDVTLREAAVKALDTLIAEYKDEHETIQIAAARFGIFLKKYSITPYNDATLEYLDMLIRDEEAKVQVGGNKKRLEDLMDDRRKHEELVKVLTRNMDNNFHAKYQVLNEAGVERLVDQLYRLKHFGKNLKSVKNTIATAHRATNRERPFRVHHRYKSGSYRGAQGTTGDRSLTHGNPPAKNRHGGSSGGFFDLGSFPWTFTFKGKKYS